MTKPILIQAALMAILNALVLLDVVHLSEEQVAGVNLAAGAVIAAVVAFFNPAVPWFGVKSEDAA